MFYLPYLQRGIFFYIIFASLAERHFKIGSAPKGKNLGSAPNAKNLLLEEQILSFKS